jgi:hypothetical protein
LPHLGAIRYTYVMSHLYRLIPLALLLVLLPAHPAHASAGRFIAIERSPSVVDVLYRYGQVDEAAPDGALAPNVNAPKTAWYPEEQRGGATDIMDGVFRGQPELITLGLHIFHFALERQAANGSFPGSVWPFHGTAMFLSEAGPALIVLEQSTYASQFSTQLKQDTGRFRKAAYAMIRSVHGMGKIDDPDKNHRRFEAAIALGSVGVLAGDSTLRRWSTIYAWQGIHMAHPNGVMPENGGHDSGYQALGMISAARYLELVATGSLYTALYNTLKRGEAWELSRVKPDGSINQAGDTRTAGCKETNPAGRCKTVFYAPIFSALAHWAAITGDARYEQAARQVWLRSGYGGH